MSLIISMPGMAAAYPTGVERVDIGTLMGIGAISGLQFWGRGNNVNAAPGGGYAFEFNDFRSGSVRKLRQPNGQAATMTAKTDSGYLGSRRTVEASAGADGRLDFSDAIMPTSGPFSVYIAVNPSVGTHRLFGSTNSGSQLQCNLVGSQIRFNVASSGAAGSFSVAADVAGGALSGRDLLVGFIRRTEGASNRLAIRYKLPGAPWIDVPGAAFCTLDGLSTGTLRTISASASMGVYTLGTGYSAAGRYGQILVFAGELSGPDRTTAETYLANYHG